MSKFVLVGRDRIAAMGDPEASPRGDADRLPRADGDENLLAGLRRGDEGAFRKLVDEYGPFLLRLALMHVPSRAVAEEVVQDTWVAVLSGIDRFEGRSSLRTWIYRILTNTAKTRAQREARSIPFASLGGGGEDQPSVDPDRFLPADDAHWAGHWAG